MNTSYTVYLAGPMRGYPRFNFDAFFAAEEKIRRLRGWEVINPATLDIEAGIEPDTYVYNEADAEKFFDRDIAAIKKADGIVMLHGWYHSTGANAEYHIAQWLRKDIHFLWQI